MKLLLCTIVVILSVFPAFAQSPLAPPKLPDSSPASTKLKVGDKAPDFGLPNGDGKLVLLADYVSRSPVVLVFYRGFWCGACTQQLTRLAQDYDKIKQAGAELIAVSVDDQTYAWSMGQTTGAKFNILSDSEKKTIISYGILNPTEHGGIAHPSIFIVDKTGNIRFLYVGKDPTDRPSDETILEEIKKVTGVK